MDAPWYSLDALPPVTVRARVWWMVNGSPRLIDNVARIWLAKPKAWRWYTEDDAKRLVPLPGKAIAEHWAPEPVCWQPYDAERWTWPGPTPEPLQPHQIPRFAGGRLRYGAVDDAEAAEMARERDDMRAEAEARDRDGPGRQKDSAPWWFEPSRIRYESPGQVSRRMAEGRVMRALAHAGSLNPTLRSRTTLTVFAELFDEANESIADRLARIEAKFARFQPLQPDHTDFPVAMDWFVAINPKPGQGKAWRLSREQFVLYLRASDKRLSSEDIATVIGGKLSRQRVDQVYERGIDLVHRAANGRLPRVDLMTPLREANRAHRRRDAYVE